MIDKLIECAEIHGCMSNPEHEVQDLRTLCETLYGMLTWNQKEKLNKQEAVKELLTWEDYL